MNPPDIQEYGSGYLLTWKPEKLTIKVSRLSDSHEDLIGEITVNVQLDGYNPHLGFWKFNFLSDVTRARLVKTLSLRCKEIRWPEALEQLCTSVVRKYRTGNQVEHLSANANIKAPEYLLSPILLSQEPVVIFGTPSSGKSYLTLLLDCLLTIGDSYKMPFSVKKTMKGIYCDWETSKETFHWRLKKLQRGMGFPEDITLDYLRCERPLSDEIESIQEKIEVCQAGFVILDSLGWAAGGELGTREGLSFFRTARKLNTSLLILAHTSKEDTERKSIFGSQFFEAGARSVWEARKTQEIGEEKFEMGLFHRKANDSKLLPPLGLRFSFDDEMTVIERCRLEDTALETSLSLGARILNALKVGALSNKQLAEELGMESKIDSIRITSSRLAKKGLLTKVGESWGLIYHE